MFSLYGKVLDTPIQSILHDKYYTEVHIVKEGKKYVITRCGNTVKLNDKKGMKSEMNIKIEGIIGRVESFTLKAIHSNVYRNNNIFAHGLCDKKRDQLNITFGLEEIRKCQELCMISPLMYATKTLIMCFSSEFLYITTLYSMMMMTTM